VLALPFSGKVGKDVDDIKLFSSPTDSSSWILFAYDKLRWYNIYLCEHFLCQLKNVFGMICQLHVWWFHTCLLLPQNPYHFLQI
jgi:hypothetical protein